jgi:hypothetical protein
MALVTEIDPRMAVFERAATSAPFPQNPKVEGLVNWCDVLVEDKANQRKVAALLNDVFCSCRKTCPRSVQADRAGTVRDPQLPAADPHVTSHLQFAVAVLFNVLGGFGFGLGLAYISFYFTYNGMNTDCAGLLSADACLSAKFADCVWTSSLGAASSNGSAVTSAASCKFPDYETVFCGQYTTADTCSGACVFDVTASECNHAAGFTRWRAACLRAASSSAVCLARGL